MCGLKSDPTTRSAFGECTPWGKMKGFKDFVMRGNLVELAVAFIMAGAFAAVVTTFTNWLLSLIPAGTTDFGDTKFGLFLTALVSFLVIAAVVYFFIVSPYEKVRARFGKQEAESSDPDDIVLLKEIRDLLASRQGGAV
jgi:large conductance mechanosensitive channel